MVVGPAVRKGSAAPVPPEQTTKLVFDLRGKKRWEKKHFVWEDSDRQHVTDGERGIANREMNGLFNLS